MLCLNKFKKHFVFATAIIIGSTMLSGNCIAQEKKDEERKKENEEAFRPYNLIGLAVTHAHVFEGRDENGKKKILNLPAFGIDYTYFFKPKWGIGLHTDVIVEEFKVEKFGGEEELERSYPIAPALMGIFKPTEHWGFLLGMGAEFAKEENFAVTRLGVEYSAELPKEWEVFGTFSYDMKWNAYDTWSFGIGIAKKLRSGK